MVAFLVAFVVCTHIDASNNAYKRLYIPIKCVNRAIRFEPAIRTVKAPVHYGKRQRATSRHLRSQVFRLVSPAPCALAAKAAVLRALPPRACEGPARPSVRNSRMNSNIYSSRSSHVLPLTAKLHYLIYLSRLAAWHSLAMSNLHCKCAAEPHLNLFELGIIGNDGP